ncbi:hypothetical protein [Microbacterium sp. GXS0129]|uniref:hypothetical protein n=1 Tax=Microbacterium sp. GXS0129 TaxID=3377836 RepID=UPI00383B0C11
MTDSSGGEFRNPYAPLPPSPPGGVPAPVDMDGARPAANPAPPQRVRARRRAAGQARDAQRSRSLPSERSTAGPGSAASAAPTSATAAPTAPSSADARPSGDPWQSLVDLSAVVAAPPRQPLRVGTFTLREVLVVVLGLAQLAAGFVSVSPGPYHPVIALGVLWVMIIALPAGAVILTVVRRCWAPQVRVGMFSVDAFIAAASVSAVLGWLNVMTLGPVAWFGCLLAVGFVAIGLAGSLIPGLREDFTSRPAALAHSSDRPLRPRAGERAVAGTDAILVSAGDAARGVVPPVRAVTMFPAAGPFRHPVPRVIGSGMDEASLTSPRIDDGHGIAAAFGSASADDGHRTGAAPVADSMGEAAPAPGSPMDAPAVAGGVDAKTESEGDRARSGSESPAHRGFWILVPEERIAVDPLGRPMFPVGPSAWTLALEDRGDRLLVRSADGRVGLLTDLTGVIRN